MRTTYHFYSPSSSGTGYYTKRFSTEKAALDYASQSDDTVAQTQVSKHQVGFWNPVYDCFMPVECVESVQKVERTLQAEIERLQKMLMDSLPSKV